MRPFDLWFARVLRLIGTALLVGFLVSLGFTSILAMDWSPSPQDSFLFGVSIIIGFSCFVLGIPLFVIGDKISPPDPWLDAWLSPFRGYKRAGANPHKDDEAESAK